MSDEELNTAISSDSLWENLVQLTDNLEDYSIFHQVINRDTTEIQWIFYSLHQNYQTSIVIQIL